MVEFTKYQGLGNDFILIDNRHQFEPILDATTAIKMCDRNFGIGADGVIFLLPGKDDSDYTMIIYNSDGSEPEMCGNGIRCLAQFIASKTGIESAGTKYSILTGAGIIVPVLQENNQVRVDMGFPQLTAAKIPTTLAKADEKVVNVPMTVDSQTWYVTCVSMGNPHCITFVDDVEEIALAEIGKKFEHHEVFPQRTNTEFIQVVNKSYLKMKVWERGAGATLACGTGACASVVAGVLNGKCDNLCTIELPGGNLTIEWNQSDGKVYMTGPAQEVFSGNYLV